MVSSFYITNDDNDNNKKEKIIMGNLKLTGTIEEILDVQTGEGAKGEWAKRTIVVTDGMGDYPNRWVMNLFKNGEHIEYATTKFNYAVGDNVDIEYSARANQHKDKWYGDNSIFRIEKIDTPVSVITEEVPASIEDDDLPF